MCDRNSIAEWQETGFLRITLAEYEKYRKKPGFWDCAIAILSLSGKKPGFCE
ncbi:MAG: hypothetical protein HC789_21775 [Microcoleus sp. CSU_2_2]|nr:hypothetical protein [Microcoleus sp. CSU_2_2]